MKSKKNALVALSVLIMLFFTLSLLSVSAGAAKKDDKAIKELEKKVKKNEKEIKGLKKAVLALQDNFDNLEERIVDLEGSCGGDAHRLGPPDYDSDWIFISYDVEPTILGHNLGGNTDNYMVDLQFRGSNIWNEVSGPNIYGYGNYGCYWHNLTVQEVRVTRSHGTNRSTDEVRIRIWVYED